MKRMKRDYLFPHKSDKKGFQPKENIPYQEIINRPLQMKVPIVSPVTVVRLRRFIYTIYC